MPKSHYESRILMLTKSDCFNDDSRYTAADLGYQNILDVSAEFLHLLQTSTSEFWAKNDAELFHSVARNLLIKNVHCLGPRRNKIPLDFSLSNLDASSGIAFIAP
ncbi:hypothetical protein CEXT_558101 [Caerostris extrusa]|uniref:Uncharacterized protein n=1 Tax=Caerostris extrusa TaxID=172846 RepID=A0AAV4WJE4_CAEEX|nr:hypothetical protein CEXT_558101 [Caerostris extrusa]